MPDLNGKVALITGAARGQGRAHAVRLASEGADIIAIDVAAALPEVPYPAASKDDLAVTEELVRAAGSRVVSAVADVQDSAALGEAVNAAVAELGRLDIVIANAGIMPVPTVLWETTDEQWQSVIGSNLTGVFQTLRAAVPVLLRQETGGSIVITASVAGVKGYAALSSYVASKHGVLGLMKSLAQELGPMGIRVNAVLPCSVDTDMIRYEDFRRMMRPDVENPSMDDLAEVMSKMQILPLPWVESEDVAEAVAYLVSDRARAITGLELRVDGGFMQK